ncbi:hypothetical protein ACOJBO_44925 [Rhizobium beringeri]
MLRGEGSGKHLEFRAGHMDRYDYIIIGAGSARLRARQPAVRRWQEPGAAARSRRQRQLPLDPYSGRLSPIASTIRGPTGVLHHGAGGGVEIAGR